MPVEGESVVDFIGVSPPQLPLGGSVGDEISKPLNFYLAYR
jgi:hypothetical protein